jgi:hypothetical protein
VPNQQRTANNGNQFSVEPPDQGLAVGNGDVLEVVNDVLPVYDSSGNPLSGVVDLNTFYGYEPAVVRGTNPVFGPSITDPLGVLRRRHAALVPGLLDARRGSVDG